MCRAVCGTLAGQVAAAAQLMSHSYEHPDQKNVVLMLCDALMDFMKVQHVLQMPPP